MNNRLITPIIMAGGNGTRLWPMSRTQSPKQFCRFGGKHSLFQNSLLRVDNRLIFNRPIVVCNQAHIDMVEEQAREIGITVDQIVCEPVGRNTAPAIALAVEASGQPSDHLFLAMPSDHGVEDRQLFQQSVTSARPVAADNYKIVLFGKDPQHAETGFGYVRAGKNIGKTECTQIRQFIEKPDREEAEQLVQQAGIYWNVGIFFFRADVLFSELEAHDAGLVRNIRQSVGNSQRDGKCLYPDPVSFERCENISFDYAVMEKTDRGAIAKLKSDWSDLGSWSAIWDHLEQDSDLNVLQGNVVNVDSEGCLITSDGPLVSTCGLENIVVVANRDAVLVASKDNSQGVKNLVAALAKKDHPTVEAHASETRPWGRFESLDKGGNHQVKRITVAPGGRLSLQYHHHRSEHWIVVEGTATVTVDSDVMDLGPCEQIFIPQGAVHRLENFTNTPVEIIEVQYGSYLGEDDIVRVEDVYSRSATPNQQPANTNNTKKKVA